MSLKHLYTDRDEARAQIDDRKLATACGRVLEYHYPGVIWQIEVSHERKCVLISIPVFTGEWRYSVPWGQILTDPSLKSVIRGGGELLERFNVPRTGISKAEFAAMIRARPITPGPNTPPPELL